MTREQIADRLTREWDATGEYAGYFLETLESLNAAGYRIVKLDSWSDDWQEMLDDEDRKDLYTITEEL